MARQPEIWESGNWIDVVAKNIRARSDGIDSTIIFASERGGKLCFRADYCNVNTVTKWDSYPFFLMEECLDSLEKAAVLSISDADSRYCYSKTDGADSSRTAFTFGHGLYVFISTSFGLRNVLAIIQRPIGVIIFTVGWELALIYLVNIIIFSKTQQKYTGPVQNVFTLLRNAGVKLKLKTCRFSTKNSTIRDLLSVLDARNLRHIHQALPSNGKKQHASQNAARFFGLCTLIRQFVPSLAHPAGPSNFEL